MKGLLAGIVLILVLGMAGFFYRNALERPGGPMPGACTMDAKICPDGTSVGRSGPSCDFVACPPPNTELPSIGAAFVVPEGFMLAQNPSSDADAVARYERMGTTSPKDAIIVRHFSVPEGKSAEEVMIAHTLLEPADMPPGNMDAFSPRILGGRTFPGIVLERFEGLVRSAYYLPQENEVLMFEVVEHGVTGWMEPGVITDNLPAHQALLKMLATLELASP